MVYTCYACKWRGDKSPRRSYHKFPTDDGLRQQWLRALGKTGPVGTRTTLCNIHFEESCFRYGQMSGYRILRDGSIPTLHLGKSPSMLISIGSEGNLEIAGHVGIPGNEAEEEVAVKIEPSCPDSNQPGSSDATSSSSPAAQKLQNFLDPLQLTSIKMEVEDEASDRERCEEFEDEFRGEAQVNAALEQIQGEIRKLAQGDEFEAFGRYVAAELRNMRARNAARLKPAIVNLIAAEAIIDDDDYDDQRLQGHQGS